MSGWYSKKNMSNNKLNYSVSWTQKYPNYWAGVRKVTEDELRLEIVDNIVGHMVSYPEAEQLLKNIFIAE